MPYRIIIILIFLFFAQGADAANIPPVENVFKGEITVLKNIKMLRDKTHRLTIRNVKDSAFVLDAKRVGITNDAIWLKAEIGNETSVTDSLYLRVLNPLLDEIIFYTLDTLGQLSNAVITGRKYPFYRRPVITVPEFVFPVKIPPGRRVTVFMRLTSQTPLVFPMDVGSELQITEDSVTHIIFESIYFGIFAIVILYSLAVGFTSRDKTFLFYSFYLFTIGVSMLQISGYAYKFFWPESPWLSMHSYMICPLFSGPATCLLAQNFLNLKNNSPWMYHTLNAIIASYVLMLIVYFFNPMVAIQLIYMNATMVVLFVMFCSFVIVLKKRLRPVKYFFMAISFFLLSTILYMLRTLDYFPHTHFTALFFEIGSTIEMALLTFAISDKIRWYRNQESEARQVALLASQNARGLAAKQQQILEKKVAKRTAALKNANSNLRETLEKLKASQAQLLTYETMASLGQLTAGVAHEINNPINFVVANIKPLEMDIRDISDVIRQYKKLEPGDNVKAQLDAVNEFKKKINFDCINEEISNLLQGIRTGAERVSFIVSSLKNFSHQEKNFYGVVDLEQSIAAALLLLRASFPPNLQVTEHIEPMPLVECVPGKINQVLVNLIDNAIYAIRQKTYAEGAQGTLRIRAYSTGNNVCISIKDNGIGIPKEVRAKIFEPFFSTKKIGEGTGLGLSTVRGIVGSHHGNIIIHSIPGKGTECIVTLPVRQKI